MVSQLLRCGHDVDLMWRSLRDLRPTGSSSLWEDRKLSSEDVRRSGFLWTSSLRNWKSSFLFRNSNGSSTQTANGTFIRRRKRKKEIY